MAAYPYAPKGKTHGEEVEKFFYGCDGAPSPPTGTGTVTPPGVVVGRVASGLAPGLPASAIV